MRKLKQVKAPISAKAHGITQGKIYNVVDSCPNDITEFSFTILNDVGAHVVCDLKSCENLAGDSWIIVL